MRVAYVCLDPGVPVFGTKGCSVHSQEVLRQLVRRGAEVTLLCADPGGATPEDLRSVRVLRLGTPAVHERAVREVALQAADRALAAVLDSLPPFDLVYERYSLWGTAGMRYAARTGIPGILEVNAPLIEEQERHRGLVAREEALARAQVVMSLARSVVCVSEPVAAWVGEMSPRARTSVVPNGVDPQRFRPRPEPSGPFTIGFVGSLKPWHGVDVLVRAVAQVNGVHLRIVGDGPERASLEQLAVGLGLTDRVEFAGMVSAAALPGELSRLHVGTAPYPTPEGYFSPMKVFEYLAAGLPVVASRSGQLPGIITDGVEGLLTPAGDALALAAATKRLRSHPEVRGRMRRAARHTAQRHTWSSAVDASLDSAGVSLPDARPEAAV